MFYRNGQALGSVNSTELRAVTEPQLEFNPVAPNPEPPAFEVAAIEPVAAAVEAIPARPSVADRKAEWVDFAVSQGADRVEAESLTKVELIELYGDDQH